MLPKPSVETRTAMYPAAAVILLACCCSCLVVRLLCCLNSAPVF